MIGFRRATFGTASAFALAAAVFVAPHEGLRTQAYPDALANNLPTVCYGETRGVTLTDTYTKPECDAMLAVAVQDFHDKLARCFPKLPDQPLGVRVALTSWVYNVGPGAACKSTLVRLANQGNLKAACDQLPRWNRASGYVVRGLSNRRGKERALCLASLK